MKDKLLLTGVVMATLLNLLARFAILLASVAFLVLAAAAVGNQSYSESIATALISMALYKWREDQHVWTI